MTNRIYNLVAILALNIFVVLCGFLPIAQYQGQMYTVFSLPINTWYGIVYKLLVLLAIYGLFHAISQVGSVLYNEAYTSTADLVIALVGFFALFYKTQQYGIIYNNNFYVLMSFLSVGLLFEAGFAGKIDRENKYISNLLSRAMAEIAAKKEIHEAVIAAAMFLLYTGNAKTVSDSVLETVFLKAKTLKAISHARTKAGSAFREMAKEFEEFVSRRFEKEIQAEDIELGEIY